MKAKKSYHIGELIVLLFILLLAFVGTHNALSPDGQALISFKLGMRSSDGVLMKWKESDRDPCGWPGVTCDLQTKRVVALSLPFRKLWGRIAPDVGNLDQLRTLYLQGNFLSGAIPIELGKLNNLEVLDISSNSLSGIIPPSLGNLERLSNLNVSTNFLIGQIPQNGVLRNFKGDSFVGNLGLCGEQVAEICKSQLEGPALTPDSSSPLQGITGLKKKSNKYSTGLLISAFSTVGVSLLVALMCFWGCFLYNRFWKSTKAPEIDLPMTPKVVIFHGDLPYTSKEIVKKIESLNESNIIGQGGFGTVYRIVMDDRSMFAVKSIGKSNLHSDRIFERELEVLGSIKHRNLVNLRGYCNSPSAKLLIYDYLPNGSLEEALHERDLEEASSISLSWGSRLRIALGAARGIAYLHHDCSPRIIHRDIKSSNILLGDNFEPHVSDFGLAKLLEDHDSHVTTVLAGTFGYLAPEYMQSGRATEKADVYSYGVVALELISGKRPNDAFFVEKGLNVVGWVNLLVKERNYEEILDPRCEHVQMDSLEAIVHIATLCINPAPDERPTMHHVVKMLESEITSPCPSDFYEESNSE